MYFLFVLVKTASASVDARFDAVAGNSKQQIKEAREQNRQNISRISTMSSLRDFTKRGEEEYKNRFSTCSPHNYTLKIGESADAVDNNPV
jgi:hypothetical protein